MSRPIHVGAYAGYRANEHPRQFTFDDDIYEIAAILDQWRTPEAMFFKVRTANAKVYLLCYDEGRDEWTLQSDFDGMEL